MRSFYGKFLQKEDFDSKIQSFLATGVVGEGDPQARELTSSERQAELEWATKRGEQQGRVVEGESRRVVPRVSRNNSIRESILARETAMRQQGNATRLEREHQQAEAQREAQREVRQGRQTLYISSKDLLHNYLQDLQNEDRTDEYLLPEVARHFYSKRPLTAEAKQEIREWNTSEKVTVRGLVDSAGNPIVPSSSRHSPIREFGANLARGILRLVGTTSSMRFATFELNYDRKGVDPVTREAIFEETCFKPFREMYPHAKEYLKYPETKEHLYKLLHTLVLLYLMEFADPNRPHAYIISLEFSTRKWKGIHIPHAHVVYFLPIDNLRSEFQLWQLIHSIGMQFKSNYWVPAAARAHLLIEAEYFEFLLMILYILKCQMAHFLCPLDNQGVAPRPLRD